MQEHNIVLGNIATQSQLSPEFSRQAVHSTGATAPCEDSRAAAGRDCEAGSAELAASAAGATDAAAPMSPGTFSA